MSRQVIVSGSDQPLSATAVRYMSLMGDSPVWNPSEVPIRQVSPTYVNLYYLRVVLTAAPGVGKSYTFTVRVAGADTPLSVTITGNDTSGQDMGHAVAVIPFDRVSIKCTPNGTPNPSTAKWSLISDSVIPGETILLACTPQNLSTSGVYYSMVGDSFHNAIEFKREILIPTAGTLTRFYIYMNAVPGAGGDFYRFIVRKNNVNTAYDRTLMNDADHTGMTGPIAVAAGDAIALVVTRGGPSPVATTFQWAVVFVPDTVGEFIIPMASDDNLLQASGVEYAQVTEGDVTWNPVRAPEEQLANAFTVQKIYVETFNPPGAGNSFGFELIRNGVITALGCTLGPADTACNSASDISIADDDFLATKGTVTIGGLATRTQAHISYLGYIEPEGIDLGADV